MLTAEKAAQLATLSNDEIRLMAGEMTAQEMRSVQAVLGAVRSRIREAKPKHAAPKTPSRNLLASIVCSTTKGLDMLDAERIYASIRRELAIPAAPAKCVPVAWRMRKDAEADWHLTMSKPMPLNQDEATWEVQPLYASAPAAPASAQGEAVAHPSHQTVRDWMPVNEALRLADVWSVGDLDNCGQWRAAIKVLADEVRALASAPAAQPSAQGEAVALTDEQIDRIAENCAKSMPDGIQGFCKTWGWRQFARELLDICRGHYRASAPAAPAQADLRAALKSVLDMVARGVPDLATVQAARNVLAAAPAQAVPLTTEQCEAIYDALDEWAQGVDRYDFGLPHAAGGGKEAGVKVIQDTLRGIAPKAAQEKM